MTQQNTPQQIEKVVEEFQSQFSGGKCVEVGTEKGILHSLTCIRKGVCVCQFENWLRQTLTHQVEMAYKEGYKQGYTNGRNDEKHEEPNELHSLQDTPNKQ